MNNPPTEINPILPDRHTFESLGCCSPCGFHLTRLRFFLISAAISSIGVILSIISCASHGFYDADPMDEHPPLCKEFLDQALLLTSSFFALFFLAAAGEHRARENGFYDGCIGFFNRVINREGEEIRGENNAQELAEPPIPANQQNYQA